MGDVLKFPETGSHDTSGRTPASAANEGLGAVYAYGISVQATADGWDVIVADTVYFSHPDENTAHDQAAILQDTMCEEASFDALVPMVSR